MLNTTIIQPNQFWLLGTGKHIHCGSVLSVHRSFVSLEILPDLSQDGTPMGPVSTLIVLRSAIVSGIGRTLTNQPIHLTGEDDGPIAA